MAFTRTGCVRADDRRRGY